MGDLQTKRPGNESPVFFQLRMFVLDWRNCRWVVGYQSDDHDVHEGFPALLRAITLSMSITWNCHGSLIVKSNARIDLFDELRCALMSDYAECFGANQLLGSIMVPHQLDSHREHGWCS